MLCTLLCTTCTQLLCSAALEERPQSLLLLTTDNTDPAKPNQPGNTIDVTFLLAGPPDVVKAVGPKVAAALGGRGGGRPGR